MEQGANRFAVPLDALVAGAQVERAAQCEGQAPVPPPPWSGGEVPFGEGGDVDGDGD